jgi:polyisoprenoid-binding protein YceI
MVHQQVNNNIFLMNQTKKTSRIFNGMFFPIPGEYNIDPMHSFTCFIAQHLVVGQVWGSFDSIKGKIIIEENPTLSSIDISIGTASVSTHNEKRDEDLRSERFLDMKKFPTITYHSTVVTAEPRGHLTVEGELTIRDITNPVSIDAVFNSIVDDPWGNNRVAFNGNTRISRKDFGLMTELMRETGGLLVGNDIIINIAAELLPQT